MNKLLQELKEMKRLLLKIKQLLETKHRPEFASTDGDNVYKGLDKWPVQV